MDIVEWLTREEVQRIAAEDQSRFSYPPVRVQDIQMVLDLLENNGIKFYRETGRSV